MRKLLTALILACAALCPAVSDAQLFRYGVTAGADLTTLKFKQDLISVDQSVGYTAGVTAEAMFSGIGFGIDIGLLYTQRGATVNLGEREIWSSLGYGSERSYLHFVEIPIHLRYKYTNLNGVEDYIAPFLYAGPTFSFLVAHNKVDAFKYANEMGLTLGAGAELWKHWQVSASYTWGMTYTLKTELLTNFSARNRTWDVKLTYLF